MGHFTLHCMEKTFFLHCTVYCSVNVNSALNCTGTKKWLVFLFMNRSYVHLVLLFFLQTLLETVLYTVHYTVFYTLLLALLCTVQDTTRYIRILVAEQSSSLQNRFLCATSTWLLNAILYTVLCTLWHIKSYTLLCCTLLSCTLYCEYKYTKTQNGWFIHSGTLPSLSPIQCLHTMLYNLLLNIFQIVRRNILYIVLNKEH